MSCSHHLGTLSSCPHWTLNVGRECTTQTTWKNLPKLQNNNSYHLFCVPETQLVALRVWSYLIFTIIKVALLSFCRWEYWGSESLNNHPKVKQLERSRGRLWIHVFLLTIALNCPQNVHKATESGCLCGTLSVILRGWELWSLHIPSESCEEKKCPYLLEQLAYTYYLHPGACYLTCCDPCGIIRDHGLTSNLKAEFE